MAYGRRAPRVNFVKWKVVSKVGDCAVCTKPTNYHGERLEDYFYVAPVFCCKECVPALREQNKTLDKYVRVRPRQGKKQFEESSVGNRNTGRHYRFGR